MLNTDLGDMACCRLGWFMGDDGSMGSDGLFLNLELALDVSGLFN